ncbi:hypothetical protein H0H93_004225 [Arthromyces matolae]|nr:hypothetical protein H0H93_004225 [Arthromyces matolae]
MCFNVTLFSQFELRTFKVSKRFKSLPILGSVSYDLFLSPNADGYIKLHASDLLNVYGGGGMADYLIRFANTLNPNAASGLQWPQYTLANPQLLTFLDGLIPVTITSDDFRVDAIKAVTNLTLANPL